MSPAQTIIPGARPLRDSTFGDLVWSRPGILKRELQLEAGSELLARLRWEKIWSADAVAESADGRWNIGSARPGGWGGKLTVRDAATGAEVAGFTPTWRGTGLLRFASGAEFHWRREGFWRPLHFWVAQNETRLVAFRSLFGLTRCFDMTVDANARRSAELPVLVSLGAYLMSRRARGSHAH